MSIAVCVKGSGCISLAADSRRTIHPYKAVDLYETWDGDKKLISFNGEAHRWVGIAESGACAPQDTPASIISEVEAGLPPCRLTIGEYAQRVHEAAARRAEGSAEYLLHASVAGFDEGEPEGRVFLVNVPASLAPVEFAAGSVGIAYSGAREFVDRLVCGYDPRLIVEDKELRSHLALPLALTTMPVEECAALAMFLVQTSVGIQRCFGQIAYQFSGGPLDVATITAEGLRFVQQTARDPECPVIERPIDSACPAVDTSAPTDLHRFATYTVV